MSSSGSSGESRGAGRGSRAGGLRAWSASRAVGYRWAGSGASSFSTAAASHSGALKTGAAGYITKESAPDELVKAIRKVQSGGKYVSQELAEKLAFDLADDSEKPQHEYLSDREFQVFQLIGAGKTMNEICHELSLSLSTINTYRTRVLEKMNIHSNAEIIHYAIKNKLVD